MVVATVIAGMSFQVMVSPPGGVWQSDNCPLGDQTGTSVLEYSSKRTLYLGMIISSTVSFSASMSLILLVISGLKLRRRSAPPLLPIGSISCSLTYRTNSNVARTPIHA
ncbi:unnamed protein product [Cochlearia groenlandica]